MRKMKNTLVALVVAAGLVFGGAGAANAKPKFDPSGTHMPGVTFTVKKFPYGTHMPGRTFPVKR